MPTDANFSTVALLLHCDGADAGTTFTDNSSYAHSVTSPGAFVTSTAQKKFGTASALGNGSGTSNNYIGVAVVAAAEMDLSTTDFTLEFWIYATADNNNILFDNTIGPGANHGMFMQRAFDGSYSVRPWTGSGYGSLTTAASVPQNEWHHVAITRASTTMRMFLDGVQQGSGVACAADMGTDSGMRIAGGLGSTPLKGNMDDIRISRMVRYTTDFTAPVAAFPDSGPTGPTIDTQPQTQSVTDPATATFSVAATTSGGPLTYQWYKNNVLIGGATASSYTTPATSHALDDGAVFKVIVTDNNGSVTSSDATLNVAVSPVSWLVAYLNLFCDCWFPAKLFLRLHKIRTIVGHTQAQVLTEITNEADGAAVWAKRRIFRKLYVRKPRA